ncbi:hypothetical protein M8J75_000777 [Diaphorina citri]|nr:hypothetical protein M8J75_000777 [Diaphorina citri]
MKDWRIKRLDDNYVVIRDLREEEEEEEEIDGGREKCGERKVRGLGICLEIKTQWEEKKGDIEEEKEGMMEGEEEKEGMMKGEEKES